MVVKIIEDSIFCADELGMGLIRVGNQDQRVFPLQYRQQLLRHNQIRQENGGPRLTKLRQLHFQICRFAEICVEFTSRDLAALIPLDPRLIPEDFFKPVSRYGATSVQGLNTRIEVEIDEDL